MSAAPLTEQEVKDLATAWYKKLDVHAPMVDILPMLSEAPEMVFPEVTFTDLAGFEGWFQRVIRIFFDEVHKVKVCDVVMEGDEAKVHIVVEWHASVWNPPEDKSKRIMLDADQDWVVKRSETTGKPVITKYVVNSLDYHEGSATL